MAPAALVLGATVLLSGNELVQGKDRSPQVQNPEKALDDIRARLKETKRALAREGEYSCCIAPSCDFCAISVGKCPCNDNLSSGDPVCHECKGGWQAGLGAIDGVKADDVKTPPHEMTKMMYEARAKKYFKR
ncbi:MAG: hypothetical protein WEB33_13650 [Bacteroidota bacterium]